MTPTYNPVPVEKEIIEALFFPEEEVLLAEEKREKRSRDLQWAAQIEATDHIPLKILFEDMTGLKQVVSTVWAVTNQRVILTDGATIPIWRIHEIKI